MPSLLDPISWSLTVSVVVFLGCAGVIGLGGWFLTETVDRLADRTGLGEALAGALFLGATTSLSGTILSVSAAWGGRPHLAIGNGLGGIAAQTAFLAIADITYRRANLEHAAASAANMMQGAVLVSLLSIILLATFSPQVTIWRVHPGSFVLVAAYVYGMHLVHRARTDPMWSPEPTKETRQDAPEVDDGRFSPGGLWARFAAFAAVVGIAGWVMEKSATGIMRNSELSGTVVGVLFTSVTTSLPELVTTVAAVRRGALTLAIGGIIGGNSYDTLFTALSDVAYREGSIYETLAGDRLLLFFVVLSSLMTGVLLLGLLRREPRGIGNIGFESFVILVLYAGAIALLFANGGA